MAEIINLNKLRKTKLRTEKQTQAVENRRKFGRMKQEKLTEKTRMEKLARYLESHKRETTED